LGVRIDPRSEEISSLVVSAGCANDFLQLADRRRIGQSPPAAVPFPGTIARPIRRPDMGIHNVVWNILDPPSETETRTLQAF